MVALQLLVASSVASAALAIPFLSDGLTSSSGLFGRDSCPAGGSASCGNTTAVPNLCCFEYPGGLLMQTQFWDPIGPDSSWTIHGLWPDHCDGTYDSSCDPSRAYTGIGTLLKNAGQSDLVNYMNTYWTDINGKNEQFWEHEWGKHGTCMSTLKPSCLPSGSPKGTEAVLFFETVVRLFKTLPTYNWLAAAGITPGTKTYTYTELQAAIKKSWGFVPALDCSSGALNGISYYYNLKGSVADGQFIPIDASIKGSCPTSGIVYKPRTGGGGGSPTSSTTSGPAPTGVPSKFTLQAYTASGKQTGCILSAGTWSTQTCAQFTPKTASGGITLTSSKGPCGVANGVFSCASGGTASTFSTSNSGNSLLLTYSGSTAFSADSTPSGTVVSTVYTGGSKAQVLTLSLVAV